MDRRPSRKRDYRLISTLDLRQGSSSSTPSSARKTSNDAAVSVVQLRINNSEPSTPEPKLKVQKMRKPFDLINKDTKPTVTAGGAAPAAKPPRSGLGQCAICLEDVGSNGGAVSTKCGHLFCYTCLMRAVKVKNKCPVCQKSLVGRASFHRIYIC